MIGEALRLEMCAEVGDHLLVEVVSSLPSVYAMVLVCVDGHVKGDVPLDKELS